MKSIHPIKTGALLIFVLALGSCQTTTQEDMKQKIKHDADAMGQSFLNKDYNTFISYLYPRVVELMGGRDRAIETLKKGPAGATIDSIEVSMPTDTLMVNNEIQCTLKEVIKIQVNGAPQTRESTLIAISNDKGKTWHFLDAGNKSLADLKQSYPNLSDRLVFYQTEIPPFLIQKVE